MAADSPSCSSSVLKGDPSSRVILWEEDEIEFFDVESDFLDVIDDSLKVVDRSVPLDNDIHKESKDPKQFFSAFGQLRDKSLKESSKLSDSFEFCDGVFGKFGGIFSSGAFSDGGDEIPDPGGDFARDLGKPFDFLNDLRGVDDSASPVEIFFKVFNRFIFLLHRGC